MSLRNIEGNTCKGYRGGIRSTQGEALGHSVGLTPTTGQCARENHLRLHCSSDEALASSEEVPRQGGSGKASRGYELGLNSE